MRTTNTNTKEESSGGIIEWAKKNPAMAAAAGAGILAILVGGTWLIVRSVKKRKEKNVSALSGVPRQGGNRKKRSGHKPGSAAGKVRFMRLK